MIERTIIIIIIIRKASSIKVAGVYKKKRRIKLE